MSECEFDQRLDSQLRQGPTPVGLLDRLRDIAALSDVELDYRLRDVLLPAGLAKRLQQVVADEALDEWLRDVPLPVSVLVRARRVTQRSGRSWLARWTLAASLLLTVSAGYFGALAGLLTALRPQGPDAWSVVVLDNGPLQLVSPRETDVAIVASPGADDPPASADLLATTEPEVVLRSDGQALAFGPAGRLFTEIPVQWDPWSNWLLKRWGVLGFAHRESQPLPELKTLPMLAARGLEVSLERGFDREFLYSRGLNPPAFTALEKPAAVITPPLSSDTGSFDLTRRLVAAGRWPEAQEVRVEDFVAAAPCRFAPAAPGTLAIRTAAGPSLFNPVADGLLQVAVTAGPAARRTLPATCLTVALDISESMAWGGRLELIRGGLEAFTQHLGPADRFSLILFREEALRAVDEARHDDVEQLLRIFDQLQAQGAVNLCEGLQQAVAAALEGAADRHQAQRLVLVTSNADLLTEPMVAKLRPMLSEARDQGLGLQVLDVSGEAESATLTNLIQAAGGAVRQVRSAADVRWALVETLTGDLSLAATAASLQVEFNPKAVAAYRLIGHEATAWGGLLPGGTTADLHVGEAAAVLFELWLYPQGGDDLAVAKLQWQDPRTSTTHHVATQRISRVQFATTFAGAPLSLQAAALAAETGEIFRQAYDFEVSLAGAFRYRPKPRSLHDVLVAADRVSPALAERSEFRRFQAVLEQAARLAPERRPGVAKAGTRGWVGGRWREAKE
ncbi:MAG: DUF3520 domain-containing protein [Planctomycetota bacterium]|nr:DUF3520 domain-containing protein [Planctomycetota bacterium]